MAPYILNLGNTKMSGLICNPVTLTWQLLEESYTTGLGNLEKRKIPAAVGNRTAVPLPSLSIPDCSVGRLFSEDSVLSCR